MLNWQPWWTKWQPWWCYTFLNVIIRFLMPQNLTLPIKMLIVGAIVKNNITCKRMYGNPKTWIWQPLWPKTCQNHHIELCLLLNNISEGSYTPKKPVTMKLSKIRGKPQKITLKSRKPQKIHAKLATLMNEVATLVMLYLSKCHYSIPDATKPHITHQNVDCRCYC